MSSPTFLCISSSMLSNFWLVKRLAFITLRRLFHHWSAAAHPIVASGLGCADTATGTGRLNKNFSFLRRSCLAISGEETTTVVTEPILRLIRGPYFCEYFNIVRCGWFPSCSKLPIMGSAGGPGGGFPATNREENHHLVQIIEKVDMKMQNKIIKISILCCVRKKQESRIKYYY